MIIIFIIRAVPQWGKDDGDYDSPTSRDETPDNERKNIKEKKKRKKEKRKKARKKEKEKINKQRVKGHC